MARRVEPAREEFDVRENEVVHRPTNATWTADPGVAYHKLYRQSMLGSVLPNGDDYREDEVAKIALQLLRERLAKK